VDTDCSVEFAVLRYNIYLFFCIWIILRPIPPQTKYRFAIVTSFYVLHLSSEWCVCVCVCVCIRVFLCVFLCVHVCLLTKMKEIKHRPKNILSCVVAFFPPGLFYISGNEPNNKEPL